MSTEGQSLPLDPTTTTTTTTTSDDYEIVPMLHSDPQEQLSTNSIDTSPHLLSSYWTLWSQASLKKNMGPLFDFNTLEDFWVVYNSIKLPSQFGFNTHRHRADLLFVRSQLNPDSTSPKDKFSRVLPEWEDANNIGGGEYRITLDPEFQDKQWELTVLSVLGGSLVYAQEVAAVWLRLRGNSSTLSIWKRSPLPDTPDDSTIEIGMSWLKMLKAHGVPVSSECSYILHKDAIAAGSGKPEKHYVWQPQDIE